MPLGRGNVALSWRCLDGTETGPFIEPIDGSDRVLHRKVEVFTSYDGLAVVSWTVDFESAEEVASSVNELLVDAIGAGADGLGAHLAGGSGP
jgi:hypothetical protein